MRVETAPKNPEWTVHTVMERWGDLDTRQQAALRYYLVTEPAMVQALCALDARMLFLEADDADEFEHLSTTISKEEIIDQFLAGRVAPECIPALMTATEHHQEFLTMPMRQLILTCFDNWANQLKDTPATTIAHLDDQQFRAYEALSDQFYNSIIKSNLPEEIITRSEVEDVLKSCLPEHLFELLITNIEDPVIPESGVETKKKRRVSKKEIPFSRGVRRR